MVFFQVPHTPEQCRTRRRQAAKITTPTRIYPSERRTCGSITVKRNHLHSVQTLKDLTTYTASERSCRVQAGSGWGTRVFIREGITWKEGLAPDLGPRLNSRSLWRACQSWQGTRLHWLSKIRRVWNQLCTATTAAVHRSPRHLLHLDLSGQVHNVSQLFWRA